MSQLMLINPKRKRRKARRNPAAANPRRRRRSRRARRNPVAMANPRRRRRSRRARRNPRFSISSIQRQTIIPAAAGGVGALALDIAWGALPLPANFKTGAIGTIAKIAGAVLAGNVAGKFIGRKTADAAVLGAVTIQAYNLVKGFAKQAMPTLPLGEYLSGDFPHYAMPGYGYDAPQLGYMNAAPVVDMPPFASGTPTMGEYLSDGDASGAYAY